MLRLTARAKINWTLDILGTREDGYHLMDMLMSSVELADTLEIQAAPSLSLILPEDAAFACEEAEAASAPVPADESNLVLKAARTLQRMTGCQKGAAMRLIKRIPTGGGMGGGSSDAAAALIGLCRLWELRVPQADLAKLALSLGADVPFLLTGGLARVKGIGERIESLPFPGPCPLVWVQPCGGLSTQEIFRAFDQAEEASVLRPRTEKAQAALLSGQLPELAKAMNNVMEPISLAKRPAIGEATKALESLGALRAMMTGSGSVVYGIFAEEEAAQRAAEQLRSRWEKSGFTKTAGESVVLEDI